MNRLCVLICVIYTSGALWVDADDLSKTTCQTNGQRVVTLDVYMRSGATNVTVKTIRRMDDSKIYRIQHVYRNGRVIMDVSDMGDGLIVSVKAQSECNAVSHFSPRGALVDVSLMDTNLLLLDHFVVTNGVLYPISSVDIHKANGAFADISELLDPANIKKSTPEEVSEQAVELMNKHENGMPGIGIKSRQAIPLNK